MGLMTIQEANLINYEEFIEIFGNVIELCALGAASVWKNRPFQSIHHLFNDICKFLDQLPESGNVEIKFTEELGEIFY